MQKSNKIRALQLGSATGLYGAERWILALIRYLDSSKIESIVSAIKDDPDLDAPVCQEADSAGFKTHVFEARGKVNVSAIYQIKDYIRKNKINIIHTHGYKADIIGLLATVNTNCLIVSTPHGWSRDSGIKIQIYELIDRLAFPFFDAVVPLSDNLYSGLEKIPRLNRKLHLIPNGVDTSEINSVTTLSSEIKDLKTNGNIILGYIGQLIPRKGLNILLHTFNELAMPNKRLCIIGEGPMQNELEKLADKLKIRDKIIFFGFRQDRIALLKGFDVFVLPSRLEGIPRCVMEAMAAGVPVVASNIPGCNKLIQDGYNGFLCQVDNISEFKSKIERILLDYNLWRSIMHNAMEHVHKFFSAAAMGSSYSRLYCDLMKISE